MKNIWPKKKNGLVQLVLIPFLQGTSKTRNSQVSDTRSITKLHTFTKKNIFPGKILAIVAMDNHGIHPIVCQSNIFDHGAHCLGHLHGWKCWLQSYHRHWGDWSWCYGWVYLPCVFPKNIFKSGLIKFWKKCNLLHLVQPLISTYVYVPIFLLHYLYIFRTTVIMYLLCNYISYFYTIIAFFYYLWLCVVSYFQLLREIDRIGNIHKVQDSPSHKVTNTIWLT